jgi:hypothetical protein
MAVTTHGNVNVQTDALIHRGSLGDIVSTVGSDVPVTVLWERR